MFLSRKPLCSLGFLETEILIIVEGKNFCIKYLSEAIGCSDKILGRIEMGESSCLPYILFRISQEFQISLDNLIDYDIGNKY